MKYQRLIAYTLIFLCISSCIKKKTADNPQNKDVEGDYFKNQEAANLNREGIKFSKNGNYDADKEAFLSSLKIEPDNPTTLSNLGLNQFLDYDYESAVRYYQKSYQLSDSTYHMAAINLGLTSYYLEQFDKGVSITSYVIDNCNDEAQLSSAYVHRSLNYLGLKECDNAQTDFDYISRSFQNIANIQYHIDDLSGKLRSCF